MNQRIVYFLIFIIVFNCLNKNEGLDIEIPNVNEIASNAMADALKDQGTNKNIKDSKISLDLENDVNIDDQVSNIVNNNLENAGVDESITELVNKKVDTAISNKNAFIIDSDQEEISNEEIVNEATVTINGEEVDTSGGGLNIGIIIFIMIVVVLMMKN